VADLTYREALRRALDDELARDPDVFLMGEEIGRFEGSYKVTAGLWQKYGPSACVRPRSRRRASSEPASAPP
jgi:pyruvate dehydrogenase E1 component beta subunit